MRFILVCFLLITSNVFAQQQADYCMQIHQIALAEQMSHARLRGDTRTLTGASDFDVKYYRCEWEVDPAVRFITGKVTVYFIVNIAASSITLDLMNPMVVDSVKQRTSTLTKLQVNNTVQVNFASTINAGTLDSVSVYYKGVPPNTGFGSFIQDQHAGTPVMWSLSEPYGARDWWPCKNGLDDKADSIDVFITAPAQYKAASNGLLQRETLLAGGTKKQTWWKHRYPIATYLVCFAVTNYSVFNNSVQLGNVTLPMQTYCYPEDLTAFQNGTQNVLDAMQLYHNTFGDYPFIKEKYGHVQFGWGGGMEHQTSTFIGNINEGLIAHELGHQWFGDKITCGSWQDAWLNEGFATFLASYYNETKYPATTVTNRLNEVGSIISQPRGSVWVDDTSNVSRIFDFRLTYLKGSHLLYMLRWKLGDSTFFRALRRYQKDPQVIYNFATTADLERNMEQESGLDLTQFFNDWYKGQGYPSYTVQWSTTGATTVKIKVSQTTSHPSVSFFALPLALKFKNATQEKTIVVDNKTNGEDFLSNIGFIADTVIIDPDCWLISGYNKSVKLSGVVSGQNIVEVFPNPAGEKIYVNLKNFTSSAVTINLFNNIGQLIYTRNITLGNGPNYLQVPFQNLPAGVYNLQIKSSSGFKYYKKLVKQ